MRLKHLITACCACCSVFAADAPLYLSLFKDIATTQEGNVLFSPACLESALLYMGKYTAGQTQEEIKALRFSAKDEYSKMKPHAAAAVFVDEGLKLNPLKTAARRVPFATDTAAALQQINAWLSKATRNPMPCSVDAYAVRPDTRMFFITTLCLKEVWAEPFSKGDTEPEHPFTMSDGTVLQVPMMVAEDSTMHHYAEGEDWQAVLLLVHPNRESRGKRSGTFVAIRPRGDVRDFAAKLTPELLAHIYAELSRPTAYVEANKQYVRYTDVKLPRFSLLPQQLDYKPMLQKHGVQSLFGPQADFSPITPEQGVFLDYLVQKNGIDVHESGFSAVSVTSGGVLGGYHEPVEQHFSITFDKPFIFMIGAAHEKITPFFMGICENPAEGAEHSEHYRAGYNTPLDEALHAPVARMLEQSPLAALFEGSPTGPCFSMQNARALKPGCKPDDLLKKFKIVVDSEDGGYDYLQVVPLSHTTVREGGKVYVVLRAGLNYLISQEDDYFISEAAQYACFWFEIPENAAL